MPVKSELSKLFDVHPSTPRVVCFGQSAGILLQDGPATAAAVMAELLDPRSKQPTGNWLCLQLQPPDLVALAAAILELAKKRGWQNLPPIFSSHLAPEGKKH